VEDIIRSFESPTMSISINIKCRSVEKLEEFLRWRKDKNKQTIIDIMYKHKMNPIKNLVKVKFNLFNLAEDNKEERYITEISSKSQELNFKMDDRFEKNIVTLDTEIKWRQKEI
jgi:guanylate kinase